MIHNLKVKECVRTWSAGNLEIEPFDVVSIVPIGMECYAEKIHSASCRDVDSLPSYVKKHFALSKKEEFKKSGLKTDVVFRDPQKQYGDFFIFIAICVKSPNWLTFGRRTVRYYLKN